MPLAEFALETLSLEVLQVLKSCNEAGLGWPGLGAGSVVWWGPFNGLGWPDPAAHIENC